MNFMMIRVLILLAAVQFTVIVDFMVIMPLGPQLMRAFSINTSEFSWIVSAYSLTGGISAVFASFFLDRYDRKKSFILIYLGFLLGTHLCAISDTSMKLLLARGFTGFFGGLLGAQVYAIAGDLIPSQFRGRSTAIIMGSFSAASVVGVPLGLYLAQLSDWHYPFEVIVYLGVFFLFLIGLTLPSMKSHIQPKLTRDDFEIYKEVFKNKKLFMGLMLYPALMFAHFSVIPFISPYLVFNTGFSEKNLFLVYMIGGIGTIFSSFIIGKWVDGTSAYNVYKKMALLAVVPILILTHLQIVPEWVVLTVTTCFFIMGSARFIPVVSLLTNIVHPKFRGGYMSLNSALQQMGSGLAAQFAGFLITTNSSGNLIGYNYVGYVTLIATFITLFIFKSVDFHSKKSH